ncbi:MULTISPECIES: HYC_CC_PP family protein [Weeksella]|uniref:Uncharacterized protein n=1 Tax=Weeksella virosa (strain ATCC 43766 / DSM 16922 / JCM 21250 / CCUG 30538 / CDC 9751 / IAM 14551 / NBRC 16016 / NCTC 11634 / CL345/78) TaxID=865938 RepID=F0NYF7_WEEVC|nr:MULTISPECIES: hypothetical protein [Weeksella]ADX67077.1 hypothetical protein Weevi_0357 [Weeksella virosa DSM 16922]MDK7675004.1 hypothetical protein [Weeksella virosa]VEH63188.1 Uncharacterised protein [Weeksella virosa]
MILLSVLMFLSNIGIVLSMHLCHGVAESISINHLNNHHCQQEEVANSCCPNPDDEDEACCTEVALQQKMIDKQLVDILKVSFFSTFLSNRTHNLWWYEFIEFYAFFVPETQKTYPNLPPIYLSHHQFIFYA